VNNINNKKICIFLIVSIIFSITTINAQAFMGYPDKLMKKYKGIWEDDEPLLKEKEGAIYAERFRGANINVRVYGPGMIGAYGYSSWSPKLKNTERRRIMDCNEEGSNNFACYKGNIYVEARNADFSFFDKKAWFFVFPDGNL